MAVPNQALPAVIETTSPRAWAFALLGIDEYFCCLSGDRLVSQVRDTLVGRLIELYDKNAGSGASSAPAPAPAKPPAATPKPAAPAK